MDAETAPRNLTYRVATLYVRVLNKILRWYLGGDRRPRFFDVASTLPSLRRIDDNFAMIREELLAVMPQREQLPRYHEFDDAQAEISGKQEGNWRVFYVHMYRAGEALPGRQLCPRTAALIDQIPNCMEAFFSILEPRKRVPPHEGPYVGKLRYHLGCIVPEDGTPTLLVREKRQTWTQGKSFLFDDSLEHAVENDCEQVRVVLVVDVLRPLPLPLHLLNLVGRRLAFANPLLDPALARLETLLSKAAM
jgi:aspartate beta-hydroxylase/beta-hydroxylase